MAESSYLKKRPTHIENLHLWSAENPLCARAAVDFGLALAKTEKVGAVSLELDRTLQGFLDDYYIRGKKLKDDMLSGFVYAINYGITRRVPLYASDKYEYEFSRKLYELSSILRDNVVQSSDEEFRNMMTDWEKAFTSFENTRAESTAENLESISKKTDGKVIHLCSESMAKKIIKFI
jgi:hypothetical protein